MAQQDARGQNFVRSFMVLRRTIGICGLGLAPLVYFVGTIMQGERIPEKSISAYYHTQAHDVFVISLFVVGIFLWFYKGYEGQGDNWAGNVAGVSAMIVAIVPTFPPSQHASTGCWAKLLAWQSDTACLQSLSRNVHYTAATVFFVMLAVFCLYFFTRSRIKDRTKLPPAKKLRNRIYILCGTLISMVLLLLSLLELAKKFRGITFHHPIADYAVLIGEVIAITAFGISWLVKGGALAMVQNHDPNTTT